MSFVGLKNTNFKGFQRSPFCLPKIIFNLGPDKINYNVVNPISIENLMKYLLKYGIDCLNVSNNMPITINS